MGERTSVLDIARRWAEELWMELAVAAVLAAALSLAHAVCWMAGAVWGRHGGLGDAGAGEKKAKQESIRRRKR